ncbi:MAG: lytic transglycosylase domain-containing protein [Acidobacteria bacterium]|nr:lytic transglycosylase domain-containing protein [Acidobacteriota bacterium]
MIAATSAMLATSVREAAPGHHPDTFSSTLRPQDLVLLEELQAWLEPAESDRAIGPAKGHRWRIGFGSTGRASGFSSASRTVRQYGIGWNTCLSARRFWKRPTVTGSTLCSSRLSSRSNPVSTVQAVSPRGALGLMQVMPETAEHLGVVNVSDPRGNLEAGARYLVFLLHRFENDLVLSLAGYNAGPRAVDRFGGLPAFPETRRFTERVLRIYIEHHRAAWAAAKGGQHEPLFPVVGHGAAPV